MYIQVLSVIQCQTPLNSNNGIKCSVYVIVKKVSSQNPSLLLMLQEMTVGEKW
jgi:hypothetical protein